MNILSQFSHSPVNFYFAKNAKNFVVEEIPLYEFSGSGEHLILKIRKKNLTTMEMLNILSKNLNVKRSEFGYAGLKDKNALTMQYISINKKFVKNLKSLDSIENIKILDSTFHDNKIKLGHLKGNKFFIRIKKLNKIDALKLKNICQFILDSGIPNYFGSQRFGKNGDNYLEGKEILDKKIKIRDKQISKFLISSYQSYLFNEWLKDRIKFSKIVNDFSPMEALKLINTTNKDINLIKNLKSQKHFLKILNGDIMQHYPHGKLFFNDFNISKDLSANNLDSCDLRFYNKQIVPTGLLFGNKSLLAKDLALEFEGKFIDESLKNQIGHRRNAWIFLENLEFIYKEDIANGELNFSLPKGSYATILLEVLANRHIEDNLQENLNNGEVEDEF